MLRYLEKTSTGTCRSVILDWGRTKSGTIKFLNFLFGATFFSEKIKLKTFIWVSIKRLVTVQDYSSQSGWLSALHHNLEIPQSSKSAFDFDKPRKPNISSATTSLIFSTSAWIKNFSLVEGDLNEIPSFWSMCQGLGCTKLTKKLSK